MAPLQQAWPLAAAIIDAPHVVVQHICHALCMLPFVRQFLHAISTSLCVWACTMYNAGSRHVENHQAVAGRRVQQGGGVDVCALNATSRLQAAHMNVCMCVYAHTCAHKWARCVAFLKQALLLGGSTADRSRMRVAAGTIMAQQPSSLLQRVCTCAGLMSA